MRASLTRLRDEIIDLYLDWREEAAAVADAYAMWATHRRRKGPTLRGVHGGDRPRRSRRSELRRRAGERRALVAWMGSP